jgi:hypothetical protein
MFFEQGWVLAAMVMCVLTFTIADPVPDEPKTQDLGFTGRMFVITFM